MRGVEHDLMDQMASSITALDIIAAEQAALADTLEGEPIADVMRAIAGNHRARASEMRAELFALKARRRMKR